MVRLSVPVAVVMPWLALLLMAVLATRLIHLLLMRWNSSSPYKVAGAAAARLPPGSRGFPVIGDTLEFFSQSPSLELVPFFKRRLERYSQNHASDTALVELDFFSYACITCI